MKETFTIDKKLLMEARKFAESADDSELTALALATLIEHRKTMQEFEKMTGSCPDIQFIERCRVG